MTDYRDDIIRMAEEASVMFCAIWLLGRYSARGQK